MENMMQMRNLEILALSETRLRPTKNQIFHKNLRLIISRSENGRQWVGFLVSGNSTHCVKQVNYVNKRMIGFDLKPMIGVTLIQVNAPQQRKLAAEKEKNLQTC